jgi:hypothetical protein
MFVHWPECEGFAVAARLQLCLRHLSVCTSDKRPFDSREAHYVCIRVL